MNAKHIPGVLLVAVLLAGAAWWFWPAASVPEKPLVVQLQPATEIPAPQEPAEPPPAPAAAPEAPPTPVDPQLELSTAVPELVQLANDGNIAALIQNFIPPDALAAMSPEERANMEQGMRAEAQSPEGQREMVYVLTATPTMDATGNRATYTFPPGNARPNITFVKINGRWYVQ